MIIQTTGWRNTPHSFFQWRIYLSDDDILTVEMRTSSIGTVRKETSVLRSFYINLVTQPNFFSGMFICELREALDKLEDATIDYDQFIQKVTDEVGCMIKTGIRQ